MIKTITGLATLVAILGPTDTARAYIQANNSTIMQRAGEGTHRSLPGECRSADAHKAAAGVQESAPRAASIDRRIRLHPSINACSFAPQFNGYPSQVDVPMLRDLPYFQVAPRCIDKQQGPGPNDSLVMQSQLELFLERSHAAASSTEGGTHLYGAIGQGVDGRWDGPV